MLREVAKVIGATTLRVELTSDAPRASGRLTTRVRPRSVGASEFSEPLAVGERRLGDRKSTRLNSSHQI